MVVVLASNPTTIQEWLKLVAERIPRHQGDRERHPAEAPQDGGGLRQQLHRSRRCSRAWRIGARKASRRPSPATPRRNARNAPCRA
eukprot:7015522-Pyramimonas_sp.AAC.1